MRLKTREARPDRKARTRPPRFAPAGQSTQLIVGADGAPDAEILDRSAALYGSSGLRRVHYSAFGPIPDASAALPPSRPPLMREHRLCQTDWLMRFHGFTAPESAGVAADGMPDLAVDPKLARALANRALFPVDPRTAGPVSETRGRPLAGPDGATVVVSGHPGSTRRTADARTHAAACSALADDLRLAAVFATRRAAGTRATVALFSAGVPASNRHLLRHR